jgi:nucleoside-diphosphate-sugar epimerase
MKRILVIGSVGQIGSELVPFLREKYGKENVVAAGHSKQPTEALKNAGPFEFVDALNRESVEKTLDQYDIDTIYHLAAVLSAAGEKNPQLAYQVNVNGFYNILEIGRERQLERIMVPSSIAAFGPETPRDNTPNETVLKPTTMYGVTKVAGELLCNYYVRRFGVDVRGVRYPGIISSETLPGGGTTDYSVEMYYAAVKGEHYTSFLREDSTLPMMYMPDALKAIVDLAEADIGKLAHHCDFNVNSMSFSPEELAASIQAEVPELTVDYKPDFRQAIADSWPRSLDDSAAKREWGWQPSYDLPSMTKDMIEKLSVRLK